jgi:hypothetical protein
MCWAGKKGIYFDKSLDEGITWNTKDKIIDAMIGGWDIEIPGIDRANGFPIIDCDRSGNEQNGHLYIAWLDQSIHKNIPALFIKKSCDSGNTWSEKKIIANRESQPDWIPGHVFGMWFTIDQRTGYLYLLYYKRTFIIDLETNVYLSYSKDGGETFKEIKISETSFTPDKTKFFGDYNGISAVNGIIRPVWTRYEHGKFSIWTSLLNEKALDKLHKKQWEEANNPTIPKQEPQNEK